MLLEGANELLIRLTSGLERVSGQDIAMTKGTMTIMDTEAIGKRGDERRANVRKAQFVYGWDWGPRVATCGIVGDVWLEVQDVVHIPSVSVVTLSVLPQARLRIEVEAENLHPFKTREAMKRKLSYYAVKRAFAPMKLILREQAGMVEVTAANETKEPIREKLECGFVSFDGNVRHTNLTEVEVPARFRGIVHRFPKANADGGLIVAIPTLQPERIQSGMLRPGDIRTLALPEARIQVIEVNRSHANLEVTLAVDTFAHAVHFDLPDYLRLSDHYFDLLPGETRTLAIYDWPSDLREESLIVRCVH